MDEPFSGLDDRLRDDVRDATLELLKDEGTAVMLVTHEPETAQTACLSARSSPRLQQH